jgi:tripartite-type tricarboxylate transporter receptor subunit TctC
MRGPTSTVMRRSFAAALSIASIASTWAHAQEFPSKPVRWIVPYAAGGTSDFLARFIGQKLTEGWGQNVNVDNRAGAAGNIGTELAAKSPPDGYTILLVASTFTMNPSVYGKLPFDVEKDFAPITILLWQPFILAVHPSLPVSNVKQLVALAKSRPGELNFSSGGSGTSGHIAAELFKSMAGVSLTHVPYRSMAPAVTALLAGEVHMMFNSPLPDITHVKSGKLKALGVTGRKRLAALPDVPTVDEAGVPGYVEGNWQGVLAPGATPRPIVARLHQDIVRALRLPELSGRFLKDGVEVIGNTPEEFAAIIRSDVRKYAELVRRAGIRAD